MLDSAPIDPKPTAPAAKDKRDHLFKAVDRLMLSDDWSKETGALKVILVLVWKNLPWVEGLSFVSRLDERKRFVPRSSRERLLVNRARFWMDVDRVLPHMKSISKANRDIVKSFQARRKSPDFNPSEKQMGLIAQLARSVTEWKK